MADFDPPWAVNGMKRAPTVAETDGGFPCGPADRELFNWLFHRVQAELNAVILGAGLTPSDADLAQVWKAIQANASSSNTTVINNLLIVGGRFATFTASGSFTVPAGVTTIRGRVWAGGGGGGGSSSASYGASGGGGGEYVEQSVAVTPGAVLTITVGAGGAQGTAGGGNGGNGGSSSIGTLISAAGGGGGRGAVTASATVGGAGGTSTGDASSLRMPGYPGGLHADQFGGFGGASFGGSISGPSLGSGNGGSAPGGGGTGATGNLAGGLGARGLVSIQY